MRKGTIQEISPTLQPECLRTLTLDRSSPLSLGRQLYLALYEMINSGVLPADTLLPATRKYSAQLGIARNTVVAAYAQLADEGLVTSAGSRSTRVIHVYQKPESNRISASGQSRSGTVNGTVTGTGNLSRRAPSASALERHQQLTPGEPDSSLFPARDWQRAMSRAARLPCSELGYQTQGQAKLQFSIARHLSVFRSLVVDPSRIILTTSTRQSLLLAATLYCDHGDLALMESPGYQGAVEAFQAQGLTLIPSPVDSSGAASPQSTAPVKLAYLTPCFQYPLGIPLSTERRDAFLTLSRNHGTVLFEDDYDSEFRDQSLPRPALAAHAQRYGACVLHAGTFSKIVFPAARVAWLVVPEAHIESAWSCLRTLGGGHGVVAQTAVSDLLDSGVISRHLQRARQIYTQRRQVLDQQVEQSSVIESVDGGGLTAVLTLTEFHSSKRLEQAIENAQLGARVLERFNWQQRLPRTTNKLVIGMGNVDSLSLPDVLGKLERAISNS